MIGDGSPAGSIGDGSPAARVMCYGGGAVTPEQAIAEANEGKLRPIYLVVGEEGYLAERVMRAFRAGVDTGAGGAFNEDRFVASEATGAAVAAAARTAPMMAPQRLVMVRGVERWEGGSKKATTGSDAFEAVGEYAADPAPWTVLVLQAQKLNGSRKLMRAAKREGFLVTCGALSRRELPGWIRQRAESKGHQLDGGVAQTLAELVGPDLSTVDDALERLSLYTGNGGLIDHDALASVVTRVRQQTVWALVDALAERNLGASLTALHDAYDGRDGLRLVGAIRWRVRQLVKFAGQRDRGSDSGAAAKAAGVAPFAAAGLERTIRRLPRATLQRWMLLLAAADRGLKGSRRPQGEILSGLLLEMCGK